MLKTLAGAQRCEISREADDIFKMQRGIRVAYPDLFHLTRFNQEKNGSGSYAGHLETQVIIGF